ncbi:MAG: hypothetical protein NT029_08135 [Armatimonadetes bacterium]|nr:hypothetical protein [Armatimonadota bacterium]
MSERTKASAEIAEMVMVVCVGALIGAWFGDWILGLVERVIR